MPIIIEYECLHFRIPHATPHHHCLNRESVLLDFRKDGGGGHQILAEGWHGLPPRCEDLAQHVLEAGVVQQELREDLLQDLHAVAKVGKIAEDVAVHVLQSLTPVGRKVPHQRLHDLDVHHVLLHVLVLGGRDEVGLRLLQEGDHLGEPVAQQLLLDEELALLEQVFEDAVELLADHATFPEDADHGIEVVDEEDRFVLVGCVRLLGKALHERQEVVRQLVQVLQQHIPGRCDRVGRRIVQ
mmetsp:Transcript_13468/g.37168  ORF Transcript_13468/g.37168 Transcript_13468/m.37168 type:complete len:241 (-) Transcript_13468:12-734(-)